MPDKTEKKQNDKPETKKTPRDATRAQGPAGGKKPTPGAKPSPAQKPTARPKPTQRSNPAPKSRQTGGPKPTEKPKSAPGTPRASAVRVGDRQGPATLPRAVKADAKAAKGATRVEKTRKKAPAETLKVMILGGLQEIGKNMTVLEYGRDIIVIDCGLSFPDEDMPGIDLVIPDVSYLEKNAERVRGILLTHGHEDHIGALPYVLKNLNVPVYGTRLTMGIVRAKLAEAELGTRPALFTVSAGDVVRLGCFLCEFIHVNHSIADACAIAVGTPVGVVFHSGDFKLDVSPIDGQIMDLGRLARLGDEGVLLMLCESTNAERHGFTPSERTVGSSLDQIFLTNRDKRVVIATFSSNVHRVQQVIDKSVKYGRKVAILGRSMVNVIGAAMELGYMDLPDGTLIDVAEIKRYRPDQLTLITTGSQGEPMSALYRLAFGEHPQVRLTPSDIVVLSASAIPGNEKWVDKIINALVRCGVRVVNDRVSDVHVSGHACSEELKLMHALVRPRFFMPVHGEDRHLFAHKEIAEFMGMTADRIFLPELGRVLEVTPTSAKWGGVVPAGRVLIDGAGVGDVGNVVLRDRRLLSEGGLIAVVAGIDTTAGELVSGPYIVSRGYVYVKESGDLMEEARYKAAEIIERCLRRKSTDIAQLKNTLKEELARFFFAANKRSPVVLPLVLPL
ncbi:MAG: RNase J family beta-CASP ribonuclease [Clostridia bacterium]|nr:RNase J family beta-CASP ribonuclease [Clostridia bacterium]